MKQQTPRLSTPKLSSVKARKLNWKILAGGFDPADAAEAAIASGILSHIESTGGRAALVSTETHLVEIWRPTSEMESDEQTEDRLHRYKLNQN